MSVYRYAAPSRLIETAHALDCPTPHKRGYTTRGDARRVLRKVKHNPSQTKFGLHPYLCGCGLFHLGHRRAAA